MKATASILLFSGMENPSQELSEEASNRLRESVLQLSRPSPNPYRSTLGYSGFAVTWDDMHVMVRDGVVKIYNDHYNSLMTDENHMSIGCFVDDLGIESQLRIYLLELILEWMF